MKYNVHMQVVHFCRRRLCLGGLHLVGVDPGDYLPLALVVEVPLFVTRLQELWAGA